MLYSSTRGLISSASFEDVALSGLAPDGGLFIPNSLPDLSHLYDTKEDLSYTDLALEIFLPFADGIVPKQDLKTLIEKSYSSFRIPNVVQLTTAGKHQLLDLFYGPTFAFKDVALQFLGNLFEYLLAKNNKQLTLIGATSGDTGSAAIYGVRGKKNIHLFVLHPLNRVTKIQELQMTSVLDDNITNIAIEGSFDNAQAIVKEIFSDTQLRKTYNLGAINSINWVRLMAQVPYYFYAAREYRKKVGTDVEAFCVPTGNFGNIYAGYMAKQMGLPIKKLILATNANDILHRTIQTGKYTVKESTPTPAPSMDIQIASNFERYLYDIADKDTKLVASHMEDLKTGEFALTQKERDKLQSDFCSYATSTEEIYQYISSYNEQGLNVDPHTATGLCAADQFDFQNVICLATAHPSKFGDAFFKATGKKIELPSVLQELEQKQTSCIHAAADINAIKDIILTILRENKDLDQ